MPGDPRYVVYPPGALAAPADPYQPLPPAFFAYGDQEAWARGLGGGGGGGAPPVEIVPRFRKSPTPEEGVGDPFSDPYYGTSYR